jgi:hypothetical protein
MRNLVTGLLLALFLAGCGDEGTERAEPAQTPSASPGSCVPVSEERGPVSTPDLDGDGTADSVEFVDQRDCPGEFVAHVGEENFVVLIREDLPVRGEDMQVLALPGRTGEVLLVTVQHPRGGFQAHLFGYAEGAFEELTVDGEPIFDFVATDTNSSPLSASCVDGGFTISEAVAHEPIGVVPAWDVFRTTYAVQGNVVTKGAREEVADNVLDAELETTYSDLTRHRLFEDCRADRG